MTRNIFDYFKPETNVPKNGFDLTRWETTTNQLGMLRAVSCVETIPNSTYKMAIDAFTRTMPLNTAAMTRIKQNWYICFVPYSQLNKNTYEMLMQRSDHQSAVELGDERTVSFNLGSVVEAALDLIDNHGKTGSDPQYFDIQGLNLGYGVLRLLDDLGYGYYGDLVGDTVNRSSILTKLKKVNPNPLRLQAYQKIWHCFFRDRYYDLPNNGLSTEIPVGPKCFNTDDINLGVRSQNPPLYYDVFGRRSVSGFLRTVCQPRYVKYKSDLFMSPLPGTQFGAVSSIPLSSDFSIDFQNVVGSTTSDEGCWYFDGSTQQSGVDYAHGGDIGLNATVGATDLRGYISNSGDFRNVRHAHGIASLQFDTVTSGTSLFDVLKLVEAQAIQRFRQKSLLAGNKTIDQFRAHHGVAPRYLADEYPDFIGSVDNEIQISEVISHADTAAAANESNLGDLAGRGYGASDNRFFEYHSNDYGILMLLTSLVPENEYNSYGLDRANQLIYPNDFYQSEYMNIGLEAIPSSLIRSTSGMLDHASDDDIPVVDPSQNPEEDASIWGFAPRYYNYKWYPSRVHGMLNTPPSGYGNDFNSYVMSRWDMIIPRGQNQTQDSNPWLGTVALTISRLYVNPRLANVIFAQNTDGTWITDQFITKCKFICKSVQPLSVLGLPQF